jgi:hypothetical protein
MKCLQYIITCFYLIQVLTFCATCNIEKRDMKEIETYRSVADFPPIPIIFSSLNADRQLPLQMMSTREYLLLNHNSTEVTLSSSNTFSHGVYHMRLDEYLLHMTSGGDNRKTNESLYFFGGNYKGIWSTMNDLYVNPPCHFCDKAGAKTLGIGGKSSGVSFHFHGLGFSEVIIGRKRWYLFPPSATPLLGHFSPNCTAAQIVEDITASARTGSSGTTHPTDSSNYSGSGTVGIEGIVLNESMSSEPDLPTVAPPSGLDTGTTGPRSSSEQGLPLHFTVHPGSLQQLREGLQACDIGPGEVLYFPPMWMHATTNLEAYNVFYSLFLDPQLMKEH